MNSPTRALRRVSSSSPWKTRISADLLAVGDGREDLGPAGGQGGVPLDDRREGVRRRQAVPVAERRDPERVRGDVDQDRPDVDPGDQGPLDGRPERDGQVRLDLGVERAAEAVAEESVDQRRPGRAADEDDLVDLVGRQLRVGEGAVDAREGPRQQGLDQVLVVGPVELHPEVERDPIGLGDELLLEPGGRLGRERLLRLLDGAEDPGAGGRGLAEVDLVLVAEAVADEVEQELVEVVAAEVGVAVAAEDLDDPALDLGDRDVEGAAAEVVDEQALPLRRVRVVGQDRGRRLVDDPGDLQAGQLAGLAGRVALPFGEEGRDGDHRLRHRVAERLLGPLLERPEDDRRDFLGRVLPVAETDGDLLAHLPLDRADGPVGGQGVLVTGRVADEQAPFGVEADDRRQDRLAVLALQDDRQAVADDGDLAVGRPQVDADDRFHGRASVGQSMSQSSPGSPSLATAPAGAERVARTSANRRTRPRQV